MLKNILKIIVVLIIAVLMVAFWIINNKNKPIVNSTSNAPEILPKTTTLFFAGDIMLSRNVAGKMIKTNDYTLPFKTVADEIAKTDIAFANLESPFNDQGNHFVAGSLIFNADPKSIEGLKLAGFDILSTANNHALDQGKNGINFTFDWLRQNNLVPLGTGLNCHQGYIINKNSIKFGFLAYSYTALNDGGKTTDPLVCDANKLAMVSADIKNLKSRVDFLIVSTHMGIEYTRKPTQAQRDFAHNAVESSADLVIGNHPHWIQTIEQYQGKWIFYSLGNFVFDQMWSTDTREGLTVTMTFDNDQVKKIELKPVIIDDYCCPRWANPDEALTILKKIDLTETILMNNN